MKRFLLLVGVIGVGAAAACASSGSDTTSDATEPAAPPNTTTAGTGASPPPTSPPQTRPEDAAASDSGDPRDAAVTLLDATTGDVAVEAGSCVKGATVFDEELATVLRGITIGAAYVRVREFRVSATGAGAIVIEQARAYGVCASGAGSSVPDACHEWVFSDVKVDNFTAAGRTVDVRDLHGHRLEIKYTNGPTCLTVDYARLDGLAVPLTLQTYTTGVLYTCGVASEPAFTHRAVDCSD